MICTNHTAFVLNGVFFMAVPLPDDVKTYIEAIVRVCDARINGAAPNTADPAQVATDKLETITVYTAIRTAALDFYSL